MKNKILVLTCVFLAVAFKSQTKQETINWLNDKLSSSPIVPQGNSNYSKFLKIDNSGHFTVTQTTEYSFSQSLNSTSTFSGNFSKLSPSSIKIKNNNGNYSIWASCSTGKCITQQSQYSDGKESFTSNEVVLGMTEDYALAERCKKAIVHLINLSGGKKETF